MNNDDPFSDVILPLESVQGVSSDASVGLGGGGGSGVSKLPWRNPPTNYSKKDSAMVTKSHSIGDGNPERSQYSHVSIQTAGATVTVVTGNQDSVKSAATTVDAMRIPSQGRLLLGQSESDVGLPTSLRLDHEQLMEESSYRKAMGKTMGTLNAIFLVFSSVNWKKIKENINLISLYQRVFHEECKNIFLATLSVFFITFMWGAICVLWFWYLWHYDWIIPSRLKYVNKYIASFTPFVIHNCLRNGFGLNFPLSSTIAFIFMVFVINLEPVELLDIELPKLFNTAPLRHFDTCMSKQADDAGGIMVLYYTLQKIMETCGNDFETDMCMTAMMDGKLVSEYSKECFLDLMEQSQFKYPERVSSKFYMNGELDKNSYKTLTYEYEAVMKDSNVTKREYFLRPFSIVRWRWGYFYEHRYGPWMQGLTQGKKGIELSYFLLKNIDMPWWTNIATLYGSNSQRLTMSVFAYVIQSSMKVYEDSNIFRYFYDFYCNVFLRKPVSTLESMVTDWIINHSLSEMEHVELSENLYSYCHPFVCKSIILPTPIVTLTVNTIKFAKQVSEMFEGENVSMVLEGNVSNSFQSGNHLMNMTPNQYKILRNMHGLKPNCSFQSPSAIAKLMHSCPNIREACVHYQHDNVMFDKAQCPKQCQNVYHADYSCNVTNANYFENVIKGENNLFSNKTRYRRKKKLFTKIVYKSWDFNFTDSFYKAVMVCSVLFLAGLAIKVVQIFMWVTKKSEDVLPLLTGTRDIPAIRYPVPPATRLPSATGIVAGTAPSRTPSNASTTSEFLYI